MIYDRRWVEMLLAAVMDKWNNSTQQNMFGFFVWMYEYSAIAGPFFFFWPFFFFLFSAIKMHGSVQKQQ